MQRYEELILSGMGQRGNSACTWSAHNSRLATSLCTSNRLSELLNNIVNLDLMELGDWNKGLHYQLMSQRGD